MGGTLSARSTLGEGAEFTVVLPLLACEPGYAPQPAHAVAAQRSGHRRTAPTVEEAVQAGCLILLAEDNETNREVMQEQLRLLGYTCEMAENGAIALQMWQAKPGRYALLLSDCHMPHLDGFGLTEAIRATEAAGTRLPIIAVTANAMQGEAQRCRERGMDDYLAKPLRVSALAPMLEKWLPASKLFPASVTAPAPAQPENGHSEPELAESTMVAFAPSFPIWDPASLTALVGDNPAMHKRLLVRFLASADAQVAEITAAAVASDPATLGRLAHSLKSAARSMGALRLGELCQDLENAGREEDVQTCSAMAAGLPAVFAAAVEEINGHLGL